MKKRFVLYPIAVLLVFIVMLLPGFLVNPYRNLTAVAQAAKNTPQQTLHQSFSSYFKKFPNGYVLTFHTGNHSNFGPTEFVIITRLKGKLQVNLINGPGPENVAQLEGDKAKEFLDERQIDLDLFDTLMKDVK